MILPIGLSIIYKVEKEFGKESSSNFSKALMIAIAYSCTIGGIATPNRNSTKFNFSQNVQNKFSYSPLMKFGEWMVFGVPLAVVMMIIAWIVLTKIVFRSDKKLVLDKKLSKKKK